MKSSAQNTTPRIVNHRLSYVILWILLLGCSKTTELNDDYFQSPHPNDKPVLFAEGTISTKFNELNASFSPDGNIFLYTVASNSYANTFYTIFICTRINGKWSRPSIAPFSGQYSDADPFFAPDGSGVYFISYRPTDESNEPKKDFDIWFAAFVNGTFETPKNLGKEINSDHDELYPAVATNGSLYFSAENGNNRYDIMISERLNDSLQKPISISDSINTTATEYDAFIAPDESFILFTSIGRSDGFGSGDLYISFKKDGNWSRGKNLGRPVNSESMDQCPMISPDGKYFFFTSFRDDNAFVFNERMNTVDYVNLLESPLNGLGNVYWMESKNVLNGQ